MGDLVGFEVSCSKWKFRPTSRLAHLLVGVEVYADRLNVNKKVLVAVTDEGSVYAINPVTGDKSLIADVSPTELTGITYKEQ